MTIACELSQKLVIGEIAARWARKTPHKEALVFRNNRYTYHQFNTHVNQLAHGLLDLGIHKGDKVAILFMNSIEFVECYFALMKIGAVMVPLNFRLAEPELDYQINHSDAKGLIFSDMFLEAIMSLKPKLSSVDFYLCSGDHGHEGVLDYTDLLKKGSLLHLDHKRW